MIVVGNGPSLKHIAAEFLQSRPTIVMNWLPRHRTDFVPTYWVCQDTICIPAIGFLNGETRRYRLSELPNLNRWPSEPIEQNTEWTTTTLFAAEMAMAMGASTILIVGFDCSMRDSPYMNHGEGVTAQPHFYDVKKPSFKHEKWNYQAGIFAQIAEDAGVRVLNLSDPTYCDTIPRSNLEDWYSSTV